MLAQLLHQRALDSHEPLQFFQQLLVQAVILFLTLATACCLALVRRSPGVSRSKSWILPLGGISLSRVPVIGETLSILFDAERFLRCLQDGFRGRTVPLSLPGRNLSIALPGEGVREMFRSSRDSVPVPGLFDALTVFFGLTSRESAVFDHAHISDFEDRHGEGYRTSHPDPSRRIIEHQRRDFTRYLTGDGLAHIMGRFHGNLRCELARPLKSPTTQEQLPDLYALVRDAVFRAEVKAIYGEAVFAVRPSFCEDFWAFYDAFPVVARGLPRWLFPSHYRARDRMLDNFRAWRSFCNSRLDLSDDDLVDCEYEPVWGTRYVRRMVQRHEKMGFSNDGIASVMLGYLFVTTANTIPATAWMVLHALLDDSLARRMRQELSLHGLLHTSSAPDILRLSGAPLLNSVYRETLRLHVAGATGRGNARPGLASHQSGSVTMTASWLGGLDASFWNEGVVLAGDGPEHPVDSFWAERFLEYLDDPASGPVRNAKAIYARANISASGSTPKTAEDDSRARIVNTGLRGHWFPFGGGAWRCPGETLARATILTSVLVLLQDFEVDLVDLEGARKVSSTHRHRTLPFGTHAFVSPVPITVRKQVAKERACCDRKL